MKISKKKLRDIIREELIKELGGFSHDSHTSLGTPSGINTDKKGDDGVRKDYQGYSSREAKNIIDKQLKMWARDLRKTQYKVIKDWMSSAKRGQIDFFDLVRGLKTGDISRAHPYETEFLHKVLTKDKIMDRFRKYFGGKKGKRGRRK